MVCKGIDTLTDNTIVGILQFPTSCWYNFYLAVMTAFFITLALILFNREKNEELRKADMISCLGVSAIVTIVISTIGTFPGIIQTDMLIKIFVGGLIFIALWMLKK